MKKIQYNIIYRGFVEDNKDPEFRNRLKIRVPEIHGNADTGTPTEFLPWAMSANTTVISPSYGIDSIVYLTFDKGDPDFPVYHGYFLKIKKDSQCYKCKHLFAAKRCLAFPQGIPDIIYMNKFDHTEEYNISIDENDGGIQFERK